VGYMTSSAPSLQPVAWSWPSVHSASSSWLHKFRFS
jgi:hypothetical protein